MACSKMIADKILDPSLGSEDQRKAMRRLTYSAYTVANVLFDKPVELDQFDMYLLGNVDEDFDRTPPVTLASRQKATDVILAQWAKNKKSASRANHTVLTLYRALPYRQGRAELSQQAPHAGGRGDVEIGYKMFADEFSAQLPSILKALPEIPSGLAPVDIRLARFGHPIVIAEPGHLRDGIPQKAAEPIDGQIFFANQDNWGLPCIESALGSAIVAVGQMKGVNREIETGDGDLSDGDALPERPSP